MAIAIYGELGRLAYTTRNSNKWTDFSTLDSNPKPTLWDAIFHRGGTIYAFDVQGITWGFDVETKVGNITRAPRHSIGCNHVPHHSHEHPMYLVENNDGELLWVVRHLVFRTRKGEDEESFYRTCGFDVYKLSESFEWVEVKDLGDYVLVVGSNSSECVPTRAIAGGKRNRIYYCDDFTVLHDIGVFNLEDGTNHCLQFGYYEKII